MVRARQDTPLHALEAFQVYLRADLYEHEYKCFSRRFLDSFQPPISLFTYAEARDRLASELPWFKLFAQAEVVAEERVDERTHRVVVELAGRTLRVNLVREDFFRIWFGDEVHDGRAALERLARIEDTAGGERALVARLPLDSAERTLAGLTSVTLERIWKIDSVEPVEP
jgi:hypothetical protein